TRIGRATQKRKTGSRPTRPTGRATVDEENFSKKQLALRMLVFVNGSNEPPAAAKAPRQAVSLVLRHRLFDEVRSTCPNPACKAEGVSMLELHHIDGDRSRSVAENLLALCSSCHTQAD